VSTEKKPADGRVGRLDLVRRVRHASGMPGDTSRGSCEIVVRATRLPGQGENAPLPFR